MVAHNDMKAKEKAYLQMQRASRHKPQCASHMCTSLASVDEPEYKKVELPAVDHHIFPKPFELHNLRTDLSS